jgi:hypothetical protein
MRSCSWLVLDFMPLPCRMSLSLCLWWLVLVSNDTRTQWCLMTVHCRWDSELLRPLSIHSLGVFIDTQTCSVPTSSYTTLGSDWARSVYYNRWRERRRWKRSFVFVPLHVSREDQQLAIVFSPCFNVMHSWGVCRRMCLLLHLIVLWNWLGLWGILGLWGMVTPGGV